MRTPGGVHITAKCGVGSLAHDLAVRRHSMRNRKCSTDLRAATNHGRSDAHHTRGEKG
jgi:hypothetical protein